MIDATVVVSMLPSADIVRKVYLDRSDGVIAAPSVADRLVLECSTIDSASARDVAGELKTSGCGLYVDTPVSVSSTLLAC